MFQLRDYQQEMIDKVVQSLHQGYRRILIVLPTGGGKCFAKGTKIIMFDGSLKNVEDIVPGDKIMGYDSTPRTIKSICSGVEKMYDIIPVKGEKYTVNESHILSLRITGKDSTKCGGKTYKPNDIANVCIRDYLKSSKTFRWVAKGWRTGIDFERKDIPLPAYLVGLWLGDGCSYKPAITTIDKEIIDYVYKYAESIGCFVKKEKITYYITKGRSPKKRNDFSFYLKKLNLIKNKHIPSVYLHNSSDVRLELLAGLIDTDGSYGHCYDYITKSKTLADDVLYLCRSLGFAAYCKKCSKSCIYKGEIRNGTYYRISISGDIEKIPCKIKRKQAVPRKQKKDVLSTGITVKYVGVGDYYGFEIEEENKLFLLGDFTVAHNTAIASELVRRSYNKGKSSIFICHRQELLEQTYNTYGKNGIVPAFIKSGMHPDYNNPMQIASVNTLVRRLDRYKVPDIVFWDESQHICSSSWKTVFEEYKDSVHVGLTATPCRLDGKPLNDMYETMIQTVSTKQLIDRGYLVPYLYYAPSIIDTSELVSANGDYTKKSLEAASFNSKIIGDNIEQYKKLAMGKRNVVFAISRKHGIGICDRYNEAGIKAEFLDGETSNKERKATLDRFRSGETSVLVNVDLFGEGFDLPAIEVVSLLRPTQSTSLYLQQVGRALRTCPEMGKQTALILDHVNNYKTHGMPDEEREWSLSHDYKPKRRTEQSVLHIKRCPNCFFAHAPALVCPNCGYHYAADGKTIEEVAGELTLIGSDEYNKLRQKEIILADSFDDLVKIEKSRNFRHGWAEIQYKLKTGIDLKSSFDGFEEIARARGYNHSWAWVQWNRIRRGY